MSKLTGVQTKLLYGTLSIFPNRVKRLVFISSLNSVVSNGVFEEDIAKNLNEIMCLASTRETTPLFPLSLSKLIWSKIDHISYVDRQTTIDTNITHVLTMNLNLQQYRVIASQILKATPDCLRYSSNNKMREDILQFFKSRTSVSCAVPA